jgi:uncharacterized protein
MMSSQGPISAVNRSRGVVLAEDVRIANTHWTRLRGLIGSNESAFRAGQALWIVPSRGVHTIAMGFPVDVLYLDRARKVLYLEESVKPWRFAPIRMSAASVLELPTGSIQKSGTEMGDEIDIATANQPEELAA